MVEALSKDGSIKRVLLYNEVVLLVDKYDSLSFPIKNDEYGIDTVIKFNFSDTGTKFTSDGNISNDQKVLSLSLNKWYGAIKVENTDPIELDLKSGKKVWIKYGTTAEEAHTFRKFHLTVWGDITS